MEAFGRAGRDMVCGGSQTITIQPGDIISTGTPPGVGMGKKPQVWLKPGDITEATVEGIGTLRNTFVGDRH
ncbi:fumarylacetoacetate hydrolase family protein [Paenibacillus sp. N4]|uniref:fumarylacetoacetate hydrolase family protein n=1 Tax=Paenibacillus vietnamensis TaxID=2590547 RepID=UPI0029657585|nr:fumarylacetoacetate hydrolase family protein [Paenibacillus vietnamensis]MCA0755825.1 fumarylacetoacetate hydrolase family protein [Paenibacillus vietnamensis]